MKQYRDLVKYIVYNGKDRGDRTGTGTRSVFGYQMRFDLSEGFPLLTTKFTSWKAMAHELVWFLSGKCDNIQYLKDHNVKIWDEWAKEDGSVGRIYGKQWRNWRTIPSDPGDDWKYGDGEHYSVDDTTYYEGPVGNKDQIKELIDTIKTNPNSRRMILTAWNPAEIEDMALPPCHTFAQFYVQNGKLSCHLYQRSGDVFLGVPFNIASYALLTHIIARLTDLEVGDLVHSFGDAHLYLNHLDKVDEMLAREDFPLPTVKISPELTDIDQLKFEHLELINYQYHPSIKAEVSV